ncbi:GATA zinc finger domain-containing protein 4-like [Aphidius gifuensis]|uniref:GATA zinc finger domain-containing protein 4-like n=1 Tax=Aphidius gifuensis TaxID=684658 RepID=UPI001CDCD827|nr:GATA zinc finger domain-containing protein 4-like [Aphidius gifuensis]
MINPSCFFVGNFLIFMIGVTWSAIYLAENINSQLKTLQSSNSSKTLSNVKKKTNNKANNNQTNTFGIPEGLPSLESSNYLNNEKLSSNKYSSLSKNEKKDPLTRRTTGHDVTSILYSNETSNENFTIVNGYHDKNETIETKNGLENLMLGYEKSLNFSSNNLLEFDGAVDGFSETTAVNDSLNLNGSLDAITLNNTDKKLHYQTYLIDTENGFVTINTTGTSDTQINISTVTGRNITIDSVATTTNKENIIPEINNTMEISETSTSIKNNNDEKMILFVGQNQSLSSDFFHDSIDNLTLQVTSENYTSTSTNESTNTVVFDEVLLSIGTDEISTGVFNMTTEK